jgi:hypothetical protein
LMYMNAEILNKTLADRIQQCSYSCVWHRDQKHVGEKTASSTHGVGKTEYPPVEDWS